MKKNGFTLVELLAVIVILSILSFIVIFSVGPTINSSKTNLSSIQIKQIEQAARLYYLQEGMNYINYNENNIKSCISVEYLVENGYFEEGVVLDLETREEITGSVLITYNSNQYIYKYQEDSCNLNEYILNLYKVNDSVEINSITYSLDSNNKLMNDKLGNNGNADDAGNIRYYGSNPNNYIDIGDRDSNNKPILYRIIGLFKNVSLSNDTTDNLIKVVRDESIGSYSWDFKSDGTHASDWNQSTLKDLLNIAYFNSTSTEYYNGSTTSITVNFASIGLSAAVRDNVEDVVWNIAGNNSYNVYADGVYTSELGTYSEGNIGLISLSDFAYASNLKNCSEMVSSYNLNELCYKDNWLIKETSYSTINFCNQEEIWGINSTGLLVNFNNSGFNNIYPTFYLKSDLEYITGKGTKSDPIIIK